MKTLLTAFLMFYCSFVSAQWTWEHPAPHGNRLYSIDFPDPDHGFVLGMSFFQKYEYGQWEAPPAIDASLDSIWEELEMIDSLNGWAIKGKSVYQYNGAVWQLAYQFPQKVFDIYFTNANNGWIVGDSGAVYHYDGISWTTQTTPYDKRLTSVYFLNDSTGWACGFGGWLIKYRSGVWSNQPYGFNGFYIDWRDVHALDTNYIWLVNDLGSALHYDGTAWTLMAVTGASSLYRVQFTDQQHGWAVGGSSGIYFYNGNTWSLQYADSAYLLFYNSTTDLEMISNQEGWVTGYAGRMVHWDGVTWTRETEFAATGSLYDIIAFDTVNVFACGQYSLLVKKNGVWVDQLPINDPTVFHDMDFATENFGIAIGSASGSKAWIYRDTAWTSSPGFVTTGSISALDVVDTSHAWAVGYTINFYDGQTWSVQATSGVILNSICMIDTANGYACGANGSLMQYSNGSWQNIYIPSGSNLEAIYFKDTTEGWIFARNAFPIDTLFIFHYSSGSWSVQHLTGIPYVFDLKINFRNANDGWATIGVNNAYLRCNGNNWYVVHPNLTASSIYGASFPDSSNGWLCGRDGAILRIFNNPPVSDISENAVSSGNNAIKVFPNPSSGYVQLQYYISEASNVRLNIYDVSGRLVAELLNEKQARGIYKAEWNCNGEKGLYFYQFSDGRVNEGGKIVVH